MGLTIRELTIGQNRLNKLVPASSLELCADVQHPLGIMHFPEDSVAFKPKVDDPPDCTLRWTGSNRYPLLTEALVVHPGPVSFEVPCQRFDFLGIPASAKFLDRRKDSVDPSGLQVSLNGFNPALTPFLVPARNKFCYIADLLRGMVVIDNFDNTGSVDAELLEETAHSFPDSSGTVCREHDLLCPACAPSDELYCQKYKGILPITHGCLVKGLAYLLPTLIDLIDSNRDGFPPWCPESPSLRLLSSPPSLPRDPRSKAAASLSASSGS